MKSNLYALMCACCALFGGALFAQPTLTSNGMRPQIGESFETFLGTYLSPGNGGPGQSWDFTALAGSAGESYTVVLPSSTPYGSNIPNATLAFSNASQNKITYMNYSGAVMEMHGAYNGQAVFNYTDPETWLGFPFTMNSSTTDNWSAVYTTSATIYRRGTTTVTADGYGTMVTPAGTFANCLRVHMVQAYQDSFNFGSPFVTTFDNDQYFWYQDGFHAVVASTYIFTSSSGLSGSNAYYNSAGPVGLEPNIFAQNGVQLYPNPASEQLTLAIDLAAQKSIEVQIVNATGQIVQQLSPQSMDRGLNELAIAVSELPNGIYFCKISQAGQEISTKRFVVSR